MKGGVTAAATAANTVGGTIIGAASSMFELGRELFNGEDISGKKILDAGVNNFLSENTVKLQNLAEEIFPNYRTEEERSEQYQREWWKHMGTANFIGDSFLKNLGFTVGAIYGGSVWTNLIGKQLAKKLASDIMKGAVVAANGDAEAAAILNFCICRLRERLHERPQVTLTCFIPDKHKSGGSYVTLRGCVRRIDDVAGEMVLTDKTVIRLADIIRIDL